MFTRGGPLGERGGGTEMYGAALSCGSYITECIDPGVLVRANVSGGNGMFGRSRSESAGL